MTITNGAAAAWQWRRVRTVAMLVPAVVAALAIAGASAAAHAAQWVLRPSVDVGATRDSNLELTTGPHTSTSGYIAGARLDVEATTETSKTKFLGAATHTNYDRSDIQDRNEQELFVNAEKRTSERGTLGFDGEYRHDALFETTVVRPGTGNVRDTDVGLSTRTEVRRNYRTLQPSFNWLLTERSAVRVGYRLTDVAFSNDAGTSLVDYEDQLANATYTRQLTPRDDVSLTANLARYRPEIQGSKSDTLQLLGGMSRAFSESVRGSVALGASRTTETAAGAEDRSSGTVASATLRQTGDLSTLEGVVSRDVAPSGIGRSVRADQFRIYWVRKLTAEVDFVLNAQLLRNRVLEGSDPNVDRRYYDVAPELRWQWLEDVYIVGSFRHRKQKYDAQPNSADSNAVFLGISYRL